MLPANCVQVVSAGVLALRRLEARLRADAARPGADPALWLAVRDVGGLADRLAATDASEWRTGRAQLIVTPQDLAVVAEWASAEAAEASPYADAPAPEALTGRGGALGALRAFLQGYLTDAFTFEAAGSIEPPTDCASAS
jgi:hypothetical protein